MRKFIERTLEKLPKLDIQRIRHLIAQMAGENELLEMVLHSMTDGVLVTDENHLLLLFNKSAERLLPFRKQEILEKTLWDMIDDPEIARFFGESLTNKEIIRDKSFIVGTGTTRTLSISIMPLVKEGTVHGSLIHVEDITEKKSNEARLRRAESLASLTTLAAGVAHEIKNPLGSIGIHLQLSQKEMKGKKNIKTDTISHNLEIIAEEVERLNRIVVDFLFAVRPMNIQLELTNINHVIRELVEFLKFELAEAGVKVELELGQHLPQVMLDDKYLKQALLNLVQNSISAMPEGGTLKLETLRRGQDVVLRIIDTGSGIPPDIMDKIFEPYFTTKDFGSGLGLTLVYKIIKEHMGEISVTSKEGKGTTFSISLEIPQSEKKLIGYGGKDE
ncbi:MAG: PAS domain S-box protein [Spirochaetales bacterium]|nr:PAS domain S-box protein [Spirochaetales bacterium]